MATMAEAEKMAKECEKVLPEHLQRKVQTDMIQVGSKYGKTATQLINIRLGIMAAYLNLFARGLLGVPPSIRHYGCSCAGSDLDPRCKALNAE